MTPLSSNAPRLPIVTHGGASSKVAAPAARSSLPRGDVRSSLVVSAGAVQGELGSACERHGKGRVRDGPLRRNGSADNHAVAVPNLFQRSRSQLCLADGSVPRTE